MTVKFYLKNSTNKLGEFEKESTIFARICYSGNKIKYYTKEKILPSNWNPEKQRAKQSRKFAEFPEFNSRLNVIDATIKSVFRSYLTDNNNIEPTDAILKNLLNKAFNRTPAQDKLERELKTFWGFFNDFLNRAKSGSRVSHRDNRPLAFNTIKNFENLKFHLEGFQTYQKRKIDFDAITLRFHTDFTHYLKTRKNLSINTIGKLITQLKVIMKEAWDNGHTNNNSFALTKFKSYQENTEKIYLTEGEIHQIEIADLSQNKRLERVRDLFLILCHTGARFSDKAQLTFEMINLDIHGNKIFNIIQTKTGTPTYIPVKQIVFDILAKYDGKCPINISNQKFNQYIQEICALEAISINDSKRKQISSHTARRSFATNEYLLGELSVREIMSITGHKTEKAFYKYIRMTPGENAANAAKKWSLRESANTSNVIRMKVS